jgi:hypothetical protein
MTDPGYRAGGPIPLHLRRNLLTALLLAVTAWCFYLPSLQFGFVNFDDVRILRDHSELYGQPGLAADLKAIFVTYFPREEPLLVRDATWAFDSRLFGFANPLGYHFGNVLMHGIVVALLFGFLLGTTRRYGFALATTAAWLLLAVHTEPVAWIMGRKDILSALFMLLALLAQTQRLTTNNRMAQFGWYAATLFLFSLGLLSKISGLTFPLVLFLHAVFFPYLCGELPPPAPLSWGRPLIREGLLFVPGLAISGAVYVWYQRTLEQMGVFDRGYTARGLAHVWNLLMVDPLAFWVYLRQVFFPWHLTVLYTWPTLRSAYPVWQIAVSLATVAAAAGVAAWLFRRRKDIFFFYAAFGAFMVPYLNLLYSGIWVADRYVYFSSFSLLAIAMSLAAVAWQRPSPAGRAGVLLLGAVFVAINGYQKISYAQAWRNGETLWQYHLALPGPSLTAYENLAAGYYADYGLAHNRHDLPGMIAALRKMEAVIDAGLNGFWTDRRQSPPPATAHLFFLRSLTEQVKGDRDAALASLLTSDRLRPRFDATNLNLARLYRELAGTTTDTRQRGIYLQAARDRLEKYITLACRGRPAPPEIQKELSDLEAEGSTSVPSSAAQGTTP